MRDRFKYVYFGPATLYELETLLSRPFGFAFGLGRYRIAPLALRMNLLDQTSCFAKYVNLACF